MRHVVAPHHMQFAEILLNGCLIVQYDFIAIASSPQNHTVTILQYAKQDSYLKQCKTTRMWGGKLDNKPSDV